TASCLAEIGHNVVCIDKDLKKIEMLKKLKMPHYEPGIEDFVRRNVKAKRLSFTTDLKDAVRSSDVIFMAVGTPSRADGSADLSYVEGVARQIAQAMDGYKVVVEKSTVPVQTGERIKRTIKIYKRKNVEFDIVSNPEFLREGSAIEDFMKPDRIVIGVESKKAEEIMQELYKPIKGQLIVTDINSAEMIKHASNSFLATKISFINAVANICEKTGADVKKVAEGMGKDKRIGPGFLEAGIGYGGSCFPKDVDAFIRISDEAGYDFRLLKEVQAINNIQKEFFVKKIHDALWVVKNKTIGVWGLSFKPDTDDMREAPSIYVINALQKEGAKIKAYCPGAMENAKKIFKGVKFCKEPYEASKGCEALVIMTEWDVFKRANMKKVKSLMKNPLVIDGRNIFEPKDMKKLGFDYHCVGRGQ
ncbi:UDP-glucose 6-dehydrogenase, partial [Candidatus Woesearchaeota archaeon RBG_13_36_6]